MANNFSKNSLRSGGNYLDLKQMNRSLVMQLIYKNAGISRSELATHLDLTVAAISKITNSLIDLGIVEEVGYVSGLKGRRAIGLEIKSADYSVLAVKVSRRKIIFGVFSLASVLLAEESIVITGNERSDDLINLIHSKIKEHIAKTEGIRAVAISVPGPFDINRQEILLMTEMNQFEGLDFSLLYNGDISQPVILSHDANAGVMFEWLSKDAYGIGDGTLVYYLIGEGVGAGIISNGNLLYGHNGMAGELGHVSLDVNGERCACGNRGCLELYCSSIAFVRKGKLQRNAFPSSILNTFPNLTAKNIIDSARNGCELSRKLCKEAAQAIGYGAVNIVNAYDPNEIVIGDEMAYGGDLIIDEIRKTIEERASKHLKNQVNVRIEDVGFDHILYGTAAIAIDHSLRNPEILSNQD